MAVTFLPPTYLDGSTSPASVFRRQAQVEAGDGSGIAVPGDLKVTPLTVPGAGIQVSPGGLMIESREPNMSRETYGVHLPLEGTEDGLSGTGSGGTGVVRRDMVIVEILDTSHALHYTPPELWEGRGVKISIVQGVALTATRVEDVAALNGVTCYAIAAIDYPANTSTISAGMIKDLRKLHRPKRESQPISYSLVEGNQETLNSVAINGEVWPNAFTNSTERADIPEWATHVDIRLLDLGVTAPASSVTVARWVQIGGDVANPATQPNIITQKTTLRATPTLGVADRRPIPAAMRGKTHRIYPMARMLGSSAPPVASRPSLDAQSSMQIELNFLQLAI